MAAQAKPVPGGPKTDKIDAAWLARLAERSMVSASFVPAAPMRQVRDLARARLGMCAEAVDGSLTDHHGRLARMLLDQIDDLATRIDTVTRMFDEAVAAVGVSATTTATVDVATGEVAALPLSYPTRWVGTSIARRRRDQLPRR